MPTLLVLHGLTEALTDSPPFALVTLFGAGLLTSLTPCIYPMIPITASLIAGTEGAGASFRRRLGLTATYVAGLALLYASVGLVAGLSGSLFGSVASHPLARVAIAALLILFALSMFGVFAVALPARVVRWAGSLPGGSYPAVFTLGATSGIVAAPCGAPAFAAVLTWVTTTGSGVLGFAYLFVFSLGMTAVLAVVGVFSGTLVLLPRSGRWMVWVTRGAGAIMLGIAGYYLWLAGLSYWG